MKDWYGKQFVLASDCVCALWHRTTILLSVVRRAITLILLLRCTKRAGFVEVGLRRGHNKRVWKACVPLHFDPRSRNFITIVWLKIFGRSKASEVLKRFRFDALIINALVGLPRINCNDLHHTSSNSSPSIMGRLH